MPADENIRWIAELAISAADARKAVGKSIPLSGFGFASEDDARRFARWIYEHSADIQRQAGIAAPSEPKQ